MIGRQDRWQEDLFVAGPLSSLIPEDHILTQVDKVLNLSWLREEVEVEVDYDALKSIEVGTPELPQGQ